MKRVILYSIGIAAIRSSGGEAGRSRLTPPMLSIPDHSFSPEEAPRTAPGVSFRKGPDPVFTYPPTRDLFKRKRDEEDR